MGVWLCPFSSTQVLIQNPCTRVHWLSTSNSYIGPAREQDSPAVQRLASASLPLAHTFFAHTQSELSRALPCARTSHCRGSYRQGTMRVTVVPITLASLLCYIAHHSGFTCPNLSQRTLSGKVRVPSSFKIRLTLVQPFLDIVTKRFPYNRWGV